jgi:hypothetical protein
MLVGDLRTAVGKDMAGNPLAQGVAIEWSGVGISFPLGWY